MHAVRLDAGYGAEREPAWLCTERDGTSGTPIRDTESDNQRVTCIGQVVSADQAADCARWLATLHRAGRLGGMAARQDARVADPNLSREQKKNGHLRDNRQMPRRHRLLSSAAVPLLLCSSAVACSPFAVRSTCAGAANVIPSQRQRLGLRVRVPTVPR
jgi:hypothetical protein